MSMRFAGFSRLIISFILIGCCSTHLLSGVNNSNDLNYVLQRYIEAGGGRAEFQKLRSLRIVGNIEFPSGKSCSVVILKKKPDLIRVTLDYGTHRITQSYDGKTAWWMRDSGRNLEHFLMEGDGKTNFIREAPIANALVNRDFEDVEFSLGPEEFVSGYNCFRIDVTFPDGWQSQHYLSKETFHDIRIVQKNPQGVVENIIIPSRFELIDGVLFSMRINQMDASERIISTMVIESIETNLGILNTAFAPPVKF